MSLKRTSNLGSMYVTVSFATTHILNVSPPRSFYYDGHTRNPCRWLLPAPSATDTLCLYSLHVPHSAAVSSAPTSLVLNLVNATDERERRLLDILRRRLFPGCLISIPVKYWTRTTDEILASRNDTPSRGVLDDYLRRESALKTVVFGSLHLRYVKRFPTA